MKKSKRPNKTQASLATRIIPSRLMRGNIRGRMSHAIARTRASSITGLSRLKRTSQSIHWPLHLRQAVECPTTRRATSAVSTNHSSGRHHSYSMARVSPTLKCSTRKIGSRRKTIAALRCSRILRASRVQPWKCLRKAAR